MLITKQLYDICKAAQKEYRVIDVCVTTENKILATNGVWLIEIESMVSLTPGYYKINNGKNSGKIKQTCECFCDKEGEILNSDNKVVMYYSTETYDVWKDMSVINNFFNSEESKIFSFLVDSSLLTFLIKLFPKNTNFLYKLCESCIIGEAQGSVYGRFLLMKK